MKQYLKHGTEEYQARIASGAQRVKDLDLGYWVQECCQIEHAMGIYDYLHPTRPKVFDDLADAVKALRGTP